MPQVPIKNESSLYINGLMISRVSPTRISVFLGQARDSTNTTDLYIPQQSFIDKNVQGANGLDTGTVQPNTFYSVFVIGDSSKFEEDTVIMSANILSSPVLPAGYDTFRRVGSVLTDNSADFVIFFTITAGHYRKVFYDNPIPILSAGNSTNFSNVSISNAIPSIPFLEATYIFEYLPDDPLNVFSVSPGSGVYSAGLFTLGFGSSFQRGTFSLPTAGGLKYKVENASDSLDILVASYIDDLDRV